MAVVFDVLAQFGLAGVFQPGAQFVQYLGQRQLLGGVGAVVRQGDVGGVPGRGAKADADQPRLHGIQRGGFGVDGRQFCLCDAG